MAAPVYIPSVLMGATTIACIFGANYLNKRTQAALMSAYALLDNSYKDFVSKTREIYGEDADIRVKDDVAKGKYEDFEIEDGKLLFYDEFSGRYFESTTEDVLKAEYELNKLVSNGAAYLNEYYELLGLIPADYGYFLGWSRLQIYETHWENWVTFDHRKVVLDDGLECTIISFVTEPTPDFLTW